MARVSSVENTDLVDHWRISDCKRHSFEEEEFVPPAHHYKLISECHVYRLTVGENIDWQCQTGTRSDVFGVRCSIFDIRYSITPFLA